MFSVIILYSARKQKVVENDSQIKSIEQIDDKIYINFNLPKYMSCSGYIGHYSEKRNIMEINLFYGLDLSMQNKTEEIISLESSPNSEMDNQDIKEIKIIGSDLSSIETYYSDNKILLEEITIKK